MIQILCLLGMYFDAVVAEVKTFFTFIQICYGHSVPAQGGAYLFRIILLKDELTIFLTTYPPLLVHVVIERALKCGTDFKKVNNYLSEYRIYQNLLNYQSKPSFYAT